MKTLAVLALFASFSASAGHFRCETKFDLGASAFGAANISFNLEVGQVRGGAVARMRFVEIESREGVSRLDNLLNTEILTAASLAEGVEFENDEDGVLLVVAPREQGALFAGRGFVAEATFSAPSIMSGNSTRQVVCRRP